MNRFRFVAPLTAALLFPAAAGAVLPEEVLPNPALEARAREISKELRCLVCQNQSIDDSNAPLARDLRVIVRERLVKGDNDAQVLGYVTDRYGDFVLLRPPFKPETWALWLAGPLFLLLGGVAVSRFLRRHAARSAGGTTFETPLNDDENRRLTALLNGDKDKI